jgi:hypothetical protein
VKSFCCGLYSLLFGEYNFFISYFRRGGGGGSYYRNFDYYYYYYSRIEKRMDHSSSFCIDDEISRQYRRFNATGTQLTVPLTPPPEDAEPVTHFVTTMNDLFRFALRDSSDGDMIGLSITNQENVQEKLLD